MEIGLVSCTKSKRSEASPPADLYTKSALFRKAREYAETYHDAWYVLSAIHHLLDEVDVAVETPTDGLRYGETLAWYNDRL